MNHYKTYRYKLVPTVAQQQRLGQWLGACRYVYNLTLDYKQTLWNQYRIKLDKNAASRELTQLVKEHVWLQDVYSQARMDAVYRVYVAYENFFKHGKGYPKFARKGKYSSFSFTQGSTVEEQHIYLPKIGLVRYQNSRPCEGQIKRTTVRECTDGWYVSLLVETDITPLPVAQNSIGVDLGIKSLLVTSQGQIVKNPKYLHKAEQKLKRLHRSVSRKKKGSSNRKRAVRKLALQNQKVANTRKDFQHKVTTSLIRENQTISVESLQIRNLLANHSLARAISDASWHQLTQMLDYKAKWYGRQFVKVAAPYTSQDCSVCGYRNKALTLKVRSWTCPQCQTVHDRDINAAKNVKTKAVGQTVTASEIYQPGTAVAEES